MSVFVAVQKGIVYQQIYIGDKSLNSTSLQSFAHESIQVIELQECPILDLGYSNILVLECIYIMHVLSSVAKLKYDFLTCFVVGQINIAKIMIKVKE